MTITRHAQTRKEADKQFTELVAQGRAALEGRGAAGHPRRLEARTEPPLLQNDDFHQVIEAVSIRQSADETLCWIMHLNL